LTGPTAEIISLMDAGRKGDREAYAQLLDRYKQDLWGYLVNHLRKREDAEDLYQEISLKVFGHLGELRDPARFRSWLFSIAVNAVRSFYRKKKPVLDDERLALEAANPDQTPLAVLERHERGKLLRRCLKQLAEREREVLLLDVMAELPQADIAQQLDLNLNTVKTILRRTRIKLARMMTEAAND